MVHLIVDGSKVGFGHQLLMVAVAYRRCTLSLAWSWVRTVCGHSKVFQTERFDILRAWAVTAAHAGYSGWRRRIWRVSSPITSQYVALAVRVVSERPLSG